MNARILKILKYPNPILRKKAESVSNIDDSLVTLAQDMLNTMYAANGLGLAANQVGGTKRIIVFDLGQREGKPNPQVLINPVILEREGKLVREEACLSVIDLAADVERSQKVVVKGIDLKGNEMTIEADGLFSVCLQHEIDHLNGILFIDHISPIKRSLYKRRLKKLLKKFEQEGASS
jgi:peptide deformylase